MNDLIHNIIAESLKHTRLVTHEIRNAYLRRDICGTSYKNSIGHDLKKKCNRKSTILKVLDCIRTYKTQIDVSTIQVMTKPVFFGIMEKMFQNLM
jgi:hypothetical protein